MARFRVRFLLVVLGALLLIAHAVTRHPPRRLGPLEQQGDLARASPGFGELALGIRVADEGPQAAKVALQQATFLQWAANAAIVAPTSGTIGPHTIVAAEANGTHQPALIYLSRRFPDASWYILADDDTYVFMANARHVAKKLDPVKGHYLGYAMHFRGCAGVKDFGEGPLFAQSSSALLMSREAVITLRDKGSGCADKYADCEVGEVRLGLCLRDGGVKMDDQRDGFHLVPPTNPNFVWPPPCDMPVAIPKAGPALMQLLYDVEREKREMVLSRIQLLRRNPNGTATDFLARYNLTGESKSIDLISPKITYADLYAKFAIPSHQATHLGATELPGGDFVELSGVGSWNDCLTACEGQRHSVKGKICVAWTHVEDKAACKLKERIGSVRSAAATMVSGVVAKNYVC